MEVPFTQSMVADALGLSAVHVNRSIQELRAAGLMQWRGKLVTITDWDGLMAAGDFDPTYLHLDLADAACSP
jgi:hypothetical protein